MKPIKLSDEQVKQIQEDICKKLSAEKFYDGKVDLKYSFKSVQGDVKLGFSTMAFAKMQALIYNFDSEVAWHGTAVRTDEGYFVKDIIVYPQEVTGSTVNTDQEGYEKWLMELDDERFNECRMQGHSHVNMGTSPSGVDMTHQESILEQLGPEDYYIFMIWNKKMQRTIYIFDMALNVMFENADIHLYIEDAGFNLDEFVEEAKDLVKTKTYRYWKKDDEDKKSKKEKGKIKEKGKTTSEYSYWQQSMMDIYDNF